jgi:hypothetical protein
MGIVVTHRAILGKTALCTLCVKFPSSLLGGPIVLEGFVVNTFRSEPGSPKKRKEVRDLTNKWFCCQDWNCMGLSGWDPWKKHLQNEGIEGNVQAMESNKGRDRRMVKNERTRVCIEGQQKPLTNTAQISRQIRV